MCSQPCQALPATAGCKMHPVASIEPCKAMPPGAKETHARGFTAHSEPGSDVGRGHGALLVEQGQRGMAVRMHSRPTVHEYLVRVHRCNSANTACKALRSVDGGKRLGVRRPPRWTRLLGRGRARNSALSPSGTVNSTQPPPCPFRVVSTTRFPLPSTTCICGSAARRCNGLQGERHFRGVVDGAW